MSTASAVPPLGRPRDPALDARILGAAVDLYGDAGWAGFSVEGVARRAGVGKASIYLRWPTKEALLDAALAASMANIPAIDTGTVRGDLIELARQLLDLYLAGGGRAAMRLGLDGAVVPPEIRERHAALGRSQILAARGIVRRGIRRGELPPSTSVTLLLDTLCGGAMMHATSTPTELRDRVVQGAATYAEKLVDFLLSSLLTSAAEG